MPIGDRSSGSPQPLSDAVQTWIHLHGLARRQATRELHDAWEAVCEPSWKNTTHPVRIHRGTLVIDVDSAALRHELTAFHAPRLLCQLQAIKPHWKLRRIEFRLQTGPPPDAVT